MKKNKEADKIDMQILDIEKLELIRAATQFSIYSPIKIVGDDELIDIIKQSRKYLKLLFDKVLLNKEK